ncbi:hypothetical protein H5410_044725 [Solanum commersonii]|uniref:Uncharacterized protein n=1 Tax=Solanum commersonii TaxID=4109 RepID=A0A9J5X7S3_SOLCO|nr:hypothetical protein H5410_044725 [Solanum commersonii]
MEVRSSGLNWIENDEVPGSNSCRGKNIRWFLFIHPRFGNKFVYKSSALKLGSQELTSQSYI